MTPNEYLKSKGYTPEAIICNDWNQTLSAFDIEEILEDYHQTKLKNNGILDLVIWRCIKPITDMGQNEIFTKGRIYEQVDGWIIDNNGDKTELSIFEEYLTSI